MAGIFKAYDVRGLYPSEIDEATVRRIGLAVRHVLDPGDDGPVVVSRDMRSHSEPLSAALIEGLRDGGLDVLDIGLATTPMNYFAVGHLEAAGGVQVTASHNPAAYNGLKFSRRGARPVSGDHGIPLLEEKVRSGGRRTGGRRSGGRRSGDPASGESPAAKRGGYRQGEIFDDYRRHLFSMLRRPAGARRLRVVADAANGMGTIYRPLLEAAGIELIPLYFELDGTFPNHEANPLKLANLRDLQAEVRRRGADLGVAFDGDADRSAFVDELGEPVGNDLTTALIAGEILEREGAGGGKAVVYDLRSSRAVAEYIREHGGEPIRERVGHSFIKATLRAAGGPFGGELAGHYYFRDAFYADNALLAVFEVLNLLWKTGAPLSRLIAPLRRYATSEETNFEVEDKQGKIALLAERYAGGEVDYLDGITVQYPDWWFNVRPSNTEPYLRLVAEAATPDQLADKMAELIAILGEPV